MALVRSNDLSREFKLTQADFQQVRELIYKFSGINLSERKFDMVYSRLGRRLRALNLTEFKQYLNHVVDDENERINFINALTTNLTHFFRERHHFEYLQNVYLPELIKGNKKRIRFWSAGCSTGEEPYSLAMVWHAIKNNYSPIDFKILATDLDTNVLTSCRTGIYTKDKLTPLTKSNLKWFKPSIECQPHELKINTELQTLIYFKTLNLIGDWPMKGPLDLIICRNVLIYFDKPTQQKLVERFYQLLAKGGCLILGHSENLSAQKSMFRPIGKTIFRKI
jgi:chemotaxis protein methyltransferase CheR